MKISVNKNDNVTMTPVVNENIFVVIGLIFKDSEYVADFSINHVTMFVGSAALFLLTLSSPYSRLKAFFIGVTLKSASSFLNFFSVLDKPQ